MATYHELATIANNSDWQGRVRYALAKSAVDVMAEDEQTAGHAARATYAGSVLDGTANIYMAGLTVLTNSTIAAAATGNGSNIPDGDIQFAVNTAWNALAGV